VVGTDDVYCCAVIFFIFVVPYTYEHMSKAYVGVSVAVVVLVLTMLGMTALRDPGFYPRSPAHANVDLGYVVRCHHAITSSCALRACT